jgi:predicted nucleic acid-binding protein
MKSPRIYLDICALKRAWDDQSQLRIQIEADAVNAILLLAEKGNLRLVHSAFHDIENARNNDKNRRLAVQTLLDSVQLESLDLEAIQQRINGLSKHGVTAMDAAHLAAAELFGADAFITCDDRLLKQARLAAIRTRALGPIRFLSEQHP